MNHMLPRWVAIGCLLVHATRASAATIDVSNYGAMPNDGFDDTAAINAAITAAAPGDVVAFAAGTYDLIKPYDATQFIRINGKTGLTLEGAISGGAPATRLLRHVVVENEADPARIIYGLSGGSLIIRNFIADNSPHLTTAGQITAIDPQGKFVKVRIFDGLPMNSGAACYAANAWDHTTHNLKHVPSLTAGTDSSGSPGNWTIDDPANRIMKLYKSTGLAFIGNINVGDDMSWHYGAAGPTSDGRAQLEFSKTDGLTLENLLIPNTINMAIRAGATNNITLTNITMRPEGNQLAVGPRDGIHLSRCTGTIVARGLDITGVRLDGFVVRTPYAEIVSLSDLTHFEIEPELATFGQMLSPGSGLNVISPAGNTYKRLISSATYNAATGRYAIVTQTALPSFATLGTPLKVAAIGPTSVSIADSNFENIAGSAMILFTDNITVDNVTNRHIMYPAIHMGSNVTAGVCGNNIAIKNSVFDSCGWVGKSGHRGMITLANDHGSYGEARLTNVTIQDNIFVNQSNGADAAINAADTSGLNVTGNHFENVWRGLNVDTASVTRYAIAANDVVLDNDENSTTYKEVSGSFAASGLRGYLGYNGSSTRYARGTAAKASWTFVAPKSGSYQVSIYKIVAASSDTAAKVSISHDGGSSVSYLDYTSGASGWTVLGTYTFTGGAGYLLTNERTNGYLRADAVRFLQQ